MLLIHCNRFRGAPETSSAVGLLPISPSSAVPANCVAAGVQRGLSLLCSFPREPPSGEHHRITALKALRAIPYCTIMPLT